MFLRAVVSGLLLWTAAPASLVRIDVQERGDVLDGRPFAAAGPYERIQARAYFVVDPDLPANRIIADIDRAPRNGAGQVEFSADLYILKPRDPRTGNGTILFEVSNRGGKGMLRFFNSAESALDPRTAAQFGDGLLLEQGYTLVWLGWQPDVPDQPGLMRLYAPVAKGIRGLVRSEFIPDERVTSFSLADRNMQVVYPVADPEGAELTVRDRVEGQRRAIPPEQWRFEERKRVSMPAGFEPGKIYEAVYRAEDPVLVGLGPAAVRDLISFLKYGGTDEPAKVLFPGRQQDLKRAIGFGISQSGRFLRTLLYYGFNQDEQGRIVFDGIMSHVAGGGRGSFNIRFGQPSRDAHPFMNLFYPTDIFPFTDLEETDPDNGQKGGILAHTAPAPKIFYTNSSYEYYGRAASLIHTTLDGRGDAALAPDTRIYLFAGGQHGPARFPPPPRHGTRNLTNPNDFVWSMRAMLAAMNAWITSGKEPPASQYPRIGRDQLVPLAALHFPRIPGIVPPARVHLAYRVEYSTEPPEVGRAFPVLLPQVDEDGNEMAGIRMPWIAAPLATYTGWNQRDASLGAPDELYSMAGSWIPFPRTRAEREKSGDPRRSIEERYASRDAYVARASAAAGEMVRGGYLLQRDVPKVIERAAREWDYLSTTR